MGNNLSLPNSRDPGRHGNEENKDEKKKEEKKANYEKPPPPTIGSARKKKKSGVEAVSKLPEVYPKARSKLKLLRMERIKDYCLLEEQFTTQMEANRNFLERSKDKRMMEAKLEQTLVDKFRESPLEVGTLEEIIDDDHAIVSTAQGHSQYYVQIMSIVDKSLLYPSCTVLLTHRRHTIVGVLQDDADSLVRVMKLDQAPVETYADIAGLESQIQEVREAVEVPLLHPELYEEMGIKPPKGVILYGAPGTGKTLIAKAVANQTSATFLRICGSELIQKYLGDGPKLVRQIFQVASECSPTIIFIDEIDAVGTKRYDTTSSGGREIQRTMLELLNQLDGFDDIGDVKVIMATNKIESLDPALIRPGRIDRKILFENPDQETKRKMFILHTSKMTLSPDVNIEELIAQKDDLSGADIKAICTEAGLLALRERRTMVSMEDLTNGRERVLKTKQEKEPEGLYL